MRLRLSIGLLLAGLVLLASPVASGQESASDQKRMVDGRISSLQEKIQAAREREGVLSSEIEVVSEKIDALQNDVDAASARLERARDGPGAAPAETRPPERALRAPDPQARLPPAPAQGGRRPAEQAARRDLHLRAHVVDLGRARFGNFSDMLDQLEFLNTIGRQDHKIANEVETAKLQMQETRNSTRKTRTAGRGDDAAVAARTAEQRAVRDRLAWSQRELATARRDKRDDARIGAGGQGRSDRAHARPAGAERSARRPRSAPRRAPRSCRRPPARHRPPASSGRSKA